MLEKVDLSVEWVAMSQPSPEKEPFHFHPDFIFQEEVLNAVGHTHGSEGMSLDEVRHRTAEEHGVDPAKITVFDPNNGEVNTAPRSDDRPTRSWGFTMSGAKWEPTGPKGDPNLN